MADDNSLEGAAPSNETPSNPHELPILPREEVLPLEAKSDELVGRPGDGRFRDTDGLTYKIITDSTRSIAGVRRAGSLLLRSLTTIIEVEDPRGIKHPNDPTRQVIPFTRLTIYTDRGGSATLVTEEYYDPNLNYDDPNHRQVLRRDRRTAPMETNTQRLTRIKKLTTDIQRLTLDMKIDEHGRTDKQRVKDIQVAHSLRTRVDRLLAIAQNIDALTRRTIQADSEGAPADFLEASLSEDDSEARIVEIDRRIGGADMIYFYTIPDIQGDEPLEIARLMYYIPAEDDPDQQIYLGTRKALYVRNPNENRYVPADSDMLNRDPALRYTNADENDIAAITGRLELLEDRYA